MKTSEKQGVCQHLMMPTIFKCRAPVMHQDFYCVKCRLHTCSYQELKPSIVFNLNGQTTK